MKNKLRDVKYCGVRKDIIENEIPYLIPERVSMLYDFITERYKVHLRKDVLKLDPPYTENEALKNYKFTNVRREHDRTTRWLINHISNNDNISYIDKIYKSILFRIYNRIETAELLNLDDEDFFTPEIYQDHSVSWVDKCRKQIKLADDKYRFFTNAYKVGGTTVGLRVLYPKEKLKYLRPVLLVDDLIKRDFARSLTECETQNDVFELLRSIKGIGNFIAYQIFVDLTYIKDFPFSENEFVVAGPGCRFGLELLLKNHGDSTFNRMTSEEVLFWIRDNADNMFEEYGWDPNNLFYDLPEFDRCLNIMSLENIFCEFQKYIRASSPNMSNPRNRYKPFEHENPFRRE